MPLDDAEDCVWMLVALGRAVHPTQWVPELHDAALKEANLKNLEAVF